MNLFDNFTMTDAFSESLGLEFTTDTMPKKEYPRGTHLKTPDPSELSSPWKHGIATGNGEVIARKDSLITIMKLEEFFEIPYAEVIPHDDSVFSPDEIVRRAMSIVVKSRSSGIVHLNSFWTSEVFSEEFDDLSLVNRNLDILNEYVITMTQGVKKKMKHNHRNVTSRNFFDKD